MIGFSPCASASQLTCGRSSGNLKSPDANLVLLYIWQCLRLSFLPSNCFPQMHIRKHRVYDRTRECAQPTGLEQ